VHNFDEPPIVTTGPYEYSPEGAEALDGNGVPASR
jgi:hypothetical protein